MRIKKGFTLAEILIVLMVIGVIATMTIPSLMKGVNEATYKTAFKKAFNAVTNIAAVEKIAGQLPVDNTSTSVVNMFASLDSNLSVKEYVDGGNATFSATSEALQEASQGGTKVTMGGKTFGSDGGTTINAGTDVTRTPWIVSEDGSAYAVIKAPTEGTCQTKVVVNSQESQVNANKKACVIVVVDVNGSGKGPNRLEQQIVSGVSSAAKLQQLEGDRYYILIASDGAAPGPKATTVSGRLLSDIK